MSALARYPLPFTIISAAVGRLVSVGEEETPSQRSAVMSDPSMVRMLPQMNFAGIVKIMAALGLPLPETSHDIKAACETNAFGGGRRAHIDFRCDIHALDAALAKSQLSQKDKITLKSALNAAGILE